MTKNKVQEVRVSGKSNAVTLSGFIHSSLNEENGLNLIAVGPKALSTAVKAISVVREHLKTTDTDLCSFPEFTKVIMDDIVVDGEKADESLTGAVEETVKELAVSGEKREFVAMKIFIQKCKRDSPVSPIKKAKHNQNKSNHGKKLTEEEMFQRAVGAKGKNLSTNSHGITRV